MESLYYYLLSLKELTNEYLAGTLMNCTCRACDFYLFILLLCDIFAVLFWVYQHTKLFLVGMYCIMLVDVTDATVSNP